MDRIKIVHIVNSLDTGGLEKGLINLVNGMEQSRFENNICCLTKAGKLKKEVIENIGVISMFKRSGTDLRLYINLVNYLKKIKPTIVHTRNWAGIDGLLCAKLANISIIIHSEHGFESIDILKQDIKRKIIRKIALAAIADKIITVSMNLKKRLINELNIKSEKIVHIPNGVNINKFDNEGREYARQKFGFKQDSFIIGIVARLDPIKNHRTLIYAFKKVVHNHPRINLIIVGDGTLGNELKHLVSQLGILNEVVFMGERNDVSEILKTFDIFVLPSLSEGMSNTILEAMATGLPVIASDVGGNSELVANEKTGFLFQKQDIQGLKEKIEKYICVTGLKNAHGYAGRNRVLKKFSLNQMIYRYQNLYSELVKNGGLT